MRLSLRAKLLLAAAALLAVPWAGYHYVQELGRHLQKELERSLLDRARLVAAALADRRELWTGASGDARGGRHVYVRTLPGPVQLDGYLEEWREYDVPAVPLEAASPGNAGGHRARWRVGRRGRHLYLAVEVDDEHIVYRDPRSLRLDRNDFVELSLTDAAGRLVRYLVATSAPGWVNAHRLAGTDPASLPRRPELRIKGEWQETAGGWVVELRIPLSMLGPRLALAVGDVDDPGSRRLAALVATGARAPAGALPSIIVPSPRMERSLARFAGAGIRLWVVDRDFRVLGIAGGLGHGADAAPGGAGPHWLYRLLLPQPADTFEDDRRGASRLDGPEVAEALAGRPTARWRTSPDGRTAILAAAWPVRLDGRVAGAVTVEETGDRIVLARSRALAILINLSLLAFGLAAGVLLVFAARLSGRIRRLRDATRAAIADDGRIREVPALAAGGDEVGDLARDIRDMLLRLAGYNRYLEKMNSRLAHELRTPVTVVRSSLENLEQGTGGGHARACLARAREGLDRLGGILTRMREASRLEQTVAAESRAPFRLDEVVRGCVEGYRLAFPRCAFRLEAEPVTVAGSPELAAQMLDKLAANACDFAEPGTPVEIRLRREGDEAVLTVANQGPPLPRDQGDLFASMVSVRSKPGDEPHLGLGLYIVRLIAGFHGGTVSARDLRDDPPSGAVFHVRLPLA